MRHTKLHSNKCSINDMVEVQIKNGRAGVEAPEVPALTTGKEWLMPRIPVTTDTKKIFAKEFLYLSRLHLDEAVNLRKRRIILARKYGLTNHEIGEELGISEAAVRGLIKRAI